MINYYIIDTETTGTKVNYHEITEISVIRCSDKKQLTRFIKADFPDRVSPVALEITNRTYEDLLKGQSKEEVVDDVNKFLLKGVDDPEQNCIVGHNIAKFDRKFLHALWGSVGKTFPAYLWLDTIPFIKAFMVKNGIQSKKWNLTASLEIMGIKGNPEAHNAKADSQNNFLLWEKLMQSGVDYVAHIERAKHILEEGDYGNCTEED
jgi:DNA polymerase III epsilon subunit-like protein